MQNTPNIPSKDAARALGIHPQNAAPRRGVDGGGIAPTPLSRPSQPPEDPAVRAVAPDPDPARDHQLISMYFEGGDSLEFIADRLDVPYSVLFAWLKRPDIASIIERFAAANEARARVIARNKLPETIEILFRTAAGSDRETVACKAAAAVLRAAKITCPQGRGRGRGSRVSSESCDAPADQPPMLPAVPGGTRRRDNLVPSPAWTPMPMPHTSAVLRLLPELPTRQSIEPLMHLLPVICLATRDAAFHAFRTVLATLARSRALIACAAMLAIIIFHSMLGGISAAQTPRPFVTDSKNVSAAVFLDHAAASTPAVDAAESSPMLRRLRGEIIRLDDEGVRLLRAAASGPTLRAEDITDDELWCVVRVSGSGSRHKPGGNKPASVSPESIVEIRRNSQGRWIAISLPPTVAEPTTTPAGAKPGGAPRVAVRLDPGKFFDAVRAWPMYRGGFDTKVSAEPPQVTPAAQPLAASIITLDRATLAKRLRSRSSSRFENVSRDLAHEQVMVRLPKGYAPRSPIGALLWVHALPDARPPETLFAAADDLGVAIVSAANAGNDRAVTERYQVVFDALQTLRERVHVDSTRIYVTGLSGGGRVSGILNACWPDVFAGSVPIVGLSSYEPFQVGKGRYVTPGFDKPREDVFKVFKTRRVAPITGTNDANHDEMAAAVAVLTRDGVTARLWDIAGMGHQMPTAAVFTEAMEWTDSPANAARLAAELSAGMAFEPIEHQIGDTDATPEQRAALVAITRKYPWTKGAWAAVELLARPPTPAAGQDR